MRLSRITAGILLLGALAFAAVHWGPGAFPGVAGRLGLAAVASPTGAELTQPSPELAEATLDRFERFRRGEGEGRLAFGGIELSSVVRYALPGLVPRGVADPTVSLSDGRVRIRARVATEAFPQIPQLRDVVELLPDTVLLELEGALVPLDQAFMALRVDKLEASRIPIPQRLIPEVLAGLGRKGPGSLPADALAVPIPDGVASVSVRNDSLVLEARR